MHGRVLIIPDKFKGTLTAAGAARAIAAGWRRARPEDVLTLMPMSDGGDGFGAVVARLDGAAVRTAAATDAAGRACRAQWWWAEERQTAIIESATSIGLARLPPGNYHPFELDTAGLGKVLLAASRHHPKQCLIGLGGSATNDGGFGMARVLGWGFYDAKGCEIASWTNLEHLAEIRPPARRRQLGRVTVAVDVQNPLLGRRGASRVYGPQKGLQRGELPKAEACLAQLAAVVASGPGQALARLPGAGAAGGLGFGLAAFAGGRLKPGFELFAARAKLERLLRTAGLVITGEGAIDRSTFMGKGVGRIAARCRSLGIPCLAVAGRIQAGRDQFAHALSLDDLFPEGQGCQRPAFALARAAAQLAARPDLSYLNARHEP